MIDLSPDDLERVQELAHNVWFEVRPGGTPADLADELDFRHARAVERAGGQLPGETPGDRAPLVGVYSAFDMTVTVPGPQDALVNLPMDGLTWVSVHPDARRRGLLRRMMTDHLHRVHDRGEAAVAGLHASEHGIYGRFGYGCATLDIKLELGRGAELSAPAEVTEAADRVSTHVVTASTPEGMAALHEAHLATVRATLGTVSRPDEKASMWWRDFPKARGSKEPWRLLLARRDGHVTGYAVFRRESRWDDARPQGKVDVAELGSVDDASLLALVRRLVDLDLTNTVTMWARSMEDPVMWWAGGPRGVKISASDALWLRLVDVPRALSERGYAAACDVVVEVLDEVCPWNAGRWRLTADASGRATCAATEDEADVVVPVAVLGAAYAGGRPVVSLARHHGLQERRPGALRELSRALRGDDQPYGAIGF